MIIDTCTGTNAHTNLYVHTTTLQDGMFPLISASQEGHDRVVEKLLHAGATVDLQNKVVIIHYLFICHL